MKKLGPKADPRKVGVVRREVSREPGATETTELKRKAQRMLGVGQGEERE